MYYVKATGDNRFGSGATANWLKIRDIKKENPDVYRIEVYFNDNKRYVLVSLENLSRIDLAFAKGWHSRQPVSFYKILEDWGLK